MPATSNEPTPEMLDLIELLFFAYRAFVREPDDLLGAFGFGRAHHRVVHFVDRHPGLKVQELLGILQITKQSLGRVLRELVDEGFVELREGRTDRRHRLLHVTPRGAQLAQQLSELQARRITAALEAAGPNSRAIVMRFLLGMVDADERDAVTRLLASTPLPAAPR